MTFCEARRRFLHRKWFSVVTYGTAFIYEYYTGHTHRDSLTMTEHKSVAAAAAAFGMAPCQTHTHMLLLLSLLLLLLLQRGLRGVRYK